MVVVVVVIVIVVVVVVVAGVEILLGAHELIIKLSITSGSEDFPLTFMAAYSIDIL